MIKIEAHEDNCKVSAEGVPVEIMSELMASTISVLDAICEKYPAKDNEDREEFREFFYNMYKETLTKTMDDILERKIK